MNKKKEELKRSFGGKTNNFLNKEEKDFEKKHLKAYLKGYKYFNCGFRTNKFGTREIVSHEVKEILTKVE